MQCDRYYHRNTYSVHNGRSSHSCKMDSSKRAWKCIEDITDKRSRLSKGQSHEMARNLGNQQAIASGLKGIGALASYVD